MWIIQLVLSFLLPSAKEDFFFFGGGGGKIIFSKNLFFDGYNIIFCVDARDFFVLVAEHNFFW